MLFSCYKYCAMADKINVIRNCICAAEHMICAECNVESAVHFFIQNGITAQLRHVGVHAKAKFADNSVFLWLLLKKSSDFRLAAVA